MRTITVILIYTSFNFQPFGSVEAGRRQDQNPLGIAD